jgi:DNA-binding response OmpR family regulator
VKPLRIALVDDDEPVRRLLRTLFDNAGHVVVAEAADGRTGVRATVAARPDAVIMDWRMPRLDGVAATRQIQARRPGVAVIAFSSSGDPRVRDAFLRAGATTYIDKTDLAGLLAAVHALALRSGGDAAPDPPATGVPEAEEPLTLSVRAWPALARADIALRGALRGDATAPVLTAVRAHAQQGNTIVLDLSEIAAVDGQGAAALRECRRLAEACGGELEVHDPSPIVRRTLRSPV